MTETMVALRSADPGVVDAVRGVVALADLPLTVHAPGSAAPRAALVLDSATETRASDPDWRREGQRFAWVSVEPGAPTPDGGRCLVLPEAAEELLGRLRVVGAAPRARVVGLLGARGGAGASSLAAVLARSCAEAGASTALVDLDLERGGLDVLVGIEHDPGLRWADLSADGGFVPADLDVALPTWCGVRVLSSDLRSVGSTPSEHAIAALAELHDVVLLDLPRDAARPGGLAGRWCDLVLLVAACDVPSAAGVQAMARSLDGVDTRLVVRGPAPGGLVPDDLAAACGLPLALAMPQERSLTAALERGVAPGEYRRGPLARGGRRLVETLGLVS